LIEPFSKRWLDDFLQKLKENGLDLKVLSIVNFDSPVLPFLKKRKLTIFKKTF